MLSYKRPDEVPVGQVWKRFAGRQIAGQPVRNYQIRDVEDKYKRQCLQILQETFLNDEPLSKLLDFKNDPTSIQSITSMWESCLNQNVSLACFTEVDGQPQELVAVNVNYVKSRNDQSGDAKGDAWSKISLILATAESLVDVFSLFQVDKYLSSCGLTVLNEHRGQNLGGRMFEAREPLCQALGIKATCTVFTAETSQALARKSGYQVLARLPYSEMAKHGLDLTGCEAEGAEVSGKKFNF